MAIHKRGTRRRQPTHPGKILRTIVIPATHLSIAEISRRLQVSRQSLHLILSENRGISPEMAIRLSCLFGNSPEHWLKMQQSHDLWHARDNLADTIGEIEEQRCA